MVALPFVSLMVSVGKARGSGTLSFPSANPRAHPRIESRLFVDDHDRRRAVDALFLAAELARSPAMRPLATFFWPPAGAFANKKKLEGWMLRGGAFDSSYHPCGTVPMGADGAEDAATDGRGRVRGVAGLFVADASLMPTLPRAHTNLTVLMMGERFGEWLRGGLL
jgi:choline dehydrogenase